MRPYNFARPLALLLAALALAATQPKAYAAVPDTQVARITAAGHSLEWNWVLPGKISRYGHAETLVHAPIASVRAKVLDYGHYRDILPSRFKTSRVVRHAGDGAVDVYMQILVLHGMVTLWDVTRFGPVEQAPPWSEII
ncbi:MAG: hypothetical protein ACREJ3_00795, partial [Polyangiaceae bacterium]